MKNIVFCFLFLFCSPAFSQDHPNLEDWPDTTELSHDGTGFDTIGGADTDVFSFPVGKGQVTITVQPGFKGVKLELLNSSKSVLASAEPVNNISPVSITYESSGNQTLYAVVSIPDKHAGGFYGITITAPAPEEEPEVVLTSLSITDENYDSVSFPALLFDDSLVLRAIATYSDGSEVDVTDIAKWWTSSKHASVDQGFVTNSNESGELQYSNVWASHEENDKQVASTVTFVMASKVDPLPQEEEPDRFYLSEDPDDGIGVFVPDLISGIVKFIYAADDPENELDEYVEYHIDLDEKTQNTLKYELEEAHKTIRIEMQRSSSQANNARGRYAALHAQGVTEDDFTIRVFIDDEEIPLVRMPNTGYAEHFAGFHHFVSDIGTVSALVYPTGEVLGIYEDPNDLQSQAGFGTIGEDGFFDLSDGSIFFEASLSQLVATLDPLTENPVAMQPHLLRLGIQVPNAEVVVGEEFELATLVDSSTPVNATIDWGDGRTSTGVGPDHSGPYLTFDYSHDTKNFFDTHAKRQMLTELAERLTSRYQNQLSAIIPGVDDWWQLSINTNLKGIPSKRPLLKKGSFLFVNKFSLFDNKIINENEILVYATADDDLGELPYKVYTNGRGYRPHFKEFIMSRKNPYYPELYPHSVGIVSKIMGFNMKMGWHFGYDSVPEGKISFREALNDALKDVLRTERGPLSKSGWIPAEIWDSVHGKHTYRNSGEYAVTVLAEDRYGFLLSDSLVIDVVDYLEGEPNPGKATVTLKNALFNLTGFDADVDGRTVSIQFYNDNKEDPVFTDIFIVPLGEVKNGKAKVDNGLSTLTLNRKQSTLKYSRGGKISGLKSPFDICVFVDDKSYETSFEKSDINNNKPLPVALLHGHEDSLVVIKYKFIPGKKSDTIIITGYYSVKDKISNLVGEEMFISYGNREYTINGEFAKQNKRNQYKLRKGSNQFIEKAVFDFDKGMFSLIIKDDIGSKANSFGIRFRDFDENVNLH